MYAIAVKTIGCGFRKRGASVRCRAAVGTGSQPAVQSHAQTRGASKQLVRHAHHTFYLPMAGMAQSLNISVACAVTLAQLQVLLPALPGPQRSFWAFDLGIATDIALLVYCSVIGVWHVVMLSKAYC